MICPFCSNSTKPISIIGSFIRTYKKNSEEYTYSENIAKEAACSACHKTWPLPSINFWETVIEKA